MRKSNEDDRKRVIELFDLAFDDPSTEKVYVCAKRMFFCFGCSGFEGKLRTLIEEQPNLR